MFGFLFSKVLALIVLLSGAALAQDVQGIPAEYSTIVTTLIGILSAVLVQPLTSIAKKLGRTTGPGTVVISAVLSLIVAFFFVFAQASATNTGLNFAGLLLIALIGFLKANGDYITRVLTTAKGTETAAPDVNVQVPATAPVVTIERPASGVEGIPGLDGHDRRGLLSAGLVEVGIGALIEHLLRQAQLPATAEQVARVAAKLAVIAPDVLDGNAHLNAGNRNRILGVILDLKVAGGLA